MGSAESTSPVETPWAQPRLDRSALVGSSRVEISDRSGTLFPAARPRANSAHEAPRTGTTKTQSIQSICYASVYQGHVHILGRSAVPCVVTAARSLCMTQALPHLSGSVRRAPRVELSGLNRHQGRLRDLNSRPTDQESVVQTTCCSRVWLRRKDPAPAVSPSATISPVSAVSHSLSGT